MRSSYYRVFARLSVLGLALSAIASLFLASAFAEDNTGSYFDEQGYGSEAKPTPAPEAPAQDRSDYQGMEYILSKSRDQIIIPEGIPEYHTVVRGDTLWGISGQYLSDNYLWPIIWEFNLQTIPNPHLIFPGQLVYLPRPGQFVQPGMDPNSSGFEDQNLQMVEANPFGQDDEKSTLIRPVLTGKQMETVGYIVANRSKEKYKIVGAELYDEFKQARGDIVYVNVGARDEAKPGDKFYVWNYQRRVYDPRTKKPFGWYVNNFGVLTLICVFEKNAMAVINDSYEPIQVGDYISPYAEIPSPWLQETNLTKCYVPDKAKTGYIVDTKMNVTSSTDVVTSAEGDIVYINLGFSENVANGDYFMVYLDRDAKSEIPELPIGELIVLRTTEKAATCYVTKALYELQLGTSVNYIQLTKSDLKSKDVVEEPGLFAPAQSATQSQGSVQ